MPQLSLIVPIYNASSYIEECLSSLVAQTMDDIEVLLVDDHGSDDSMTIAQRFVETHPSGKTFRFLSTPHNMGPGPARNIGIEAARGRYVGFVDSDDRVEKDYVETLLSLFDKDTAFTACSYKYELRNNKSFKNKKEKIKTFTKSEALKEVISDKTFFGFTWNKMYKKSILKDIRYNKEVHAGEDLVFNIDYIDNCPEDSIVKFTTKKLYHYTKTTSM